MLQKLLQSGKRWTVACLRLTPLAISSFGSRPSQTAALHYPAYRNCDGFTMVSQLESVILAVVPPHPWYHPVIAVRPNLLYHMRPKQFVSSTHFFCASILEG